MLTKTSLKLGLGQKMFEGTLFSIQFWGSRVILQFRECGLDDAVNFFFLCCSNQEDGLQTV